jgi:protein-disulfide isomerase
MNKPVISALIAGLLAFVPFAQAQEDNSAVDRMVEDKLEEYVNSEAFEQRVEQVIIQFVEKQNRARAEQQRQARQAAVDNVAPVDPDSDYIRGEPDAAFTLIEYSDYECPYCKRFHGTAKTFVERNPDVNWVYRHFPLNFHNPGAQKQAEAAECAGMLGGNEAFWQYSDLIFERTKSNGKGFPITELGPLASEIGLDREAFGACLESERFKDKVLAQMANGQAAGVTGTPGNFLVHNASGEALPISGAQPLSALEQALGKMKDAVE